ncbi:protein phosphatase 1 regulatory subunit 21 [Trichogramma pretiosum]|uniref:protein phosphatase 1 regulatory subunit 21 n=1 Tax=Trichogramma pretiosum TaxID=7493 RepID=UPI0006C9D816|nr:protein phosphatase 1 regulatory subunit 21 [Trichogramma pretiosum]
MDNSDGQLSIKYQKLATEYSKIRAQLSVLKKAVIDEQTRNAETKEQLKVKEVELRRAEQELDSLTFRNQQLTKRVTVLQEDLDNIQNKTKKTKSKNESKAQTVPVPPNHILDEEFQKKIVENATLLTQLSEKNTELDNLHDRVQFLENKLEISQKVKIELDNKYQTNIEKLEKEKSDLLRKCSEKVRKEETVSWSSGEGKKESYDFDLKFGSSNSKQDPSPFSTPSASRRSSKSTVEIGATRSDDIDFTKLCELEKELTHWRTQYNTLKIKFDELAQKENNEQQRLDANGLETVQVSNMIGKLTKPFALPEEIEAREKRISEYYMQEMDKLFKEKYLYHVRNLAIAANTEVMNVHLDASEEKREKCEAELADALQKYKNLQQEMEQQEANYKLQLNTMSEHLANMNEKLINQTDEIQRLKFELSNKNGKRGR